MSDKTRKLADDALRERRFREGVARERAKPDDLPRCLCGLTWHQTKMWAHAKDRWAKPIYYCPVCLPEEYREEILGVGCGPYQGDGPAMRVVQK